VQTSVQTLFGDHEGRPPPQWTKRRRLQTASQDEYGAGVRLRPDFSYTISRSRPGQRMSIIVVSAAMRVRVSDPALLGDLQRYLRATECMAGQLEEDTLDVSIPRAPSEERARREVAIYVQASQAMHPAARAEIVA
jgi:hypothetical protein